ncbi:1-phosphofructokinase [Entomoplasma freundtii]|uniref:1-phosphofructokinase n=1 Tax=Entomoplasma freundtii TaxID=74700 RepID=A0A2K8NSR8_9MOLU|nr:1-phosphofructokinase family hexose kinase [Entomoplasma freundtii]ATZ16208.1 1-phosphofructokinase [Entomoplasma freundtii]TDY56891.1 1-phosphofructokinase [Entomoplasma freundtii]
MTENKIHVISLSPALDYILKFDNFEKDKTNRPIATEIYPAGKGIHIAMLLKNLNIDSESLIFTNGNFEKFFYKGLDKIGLKYTKFQSQGEIRINLKLIDDLQTECSVPSSHISNEELKKLRNHLWNTVKPNDFVIVSGSIPEGVESSIYGEIVDLCNSLGARSVVDSFGESLNVAIEKKPFLIKPNLEELAITTNLTIKTDHEVVKAARLLINKGAENVLVSLGSRGAIFVTKEQAFKCPIGNWPHQLVNAAGAGDSMLAGFLSELLQNKDYQTALKTGVICGSATAYSTRIADFSLIQELKQTINSLPITNFN